VAAILSASDRCARREAEQGRGLVPQREQASDAVGVVVRAGVGPLVGRARVVGRVHRRAQQAVVGERQDRLHDRPLQRRQPAVDLLVLRRMREHRTRRIGQAGQFGGGDRPRPGIGRIEHGFLERGLGLAQFDLDVAEAGARRFLERDAGQAEAAQAVLDQGLPGTIERRECRRLAHRADRLVQRPVLSERAAVLGDLLQCGRVRLAQRRRILDAVQVRDRRERAPELFLEAFERRDQAGEIARGRIGDQAVDLVPVVGEHGRHGRQGVFGRERLEVGQLAVGEQGVVGGRHDRKGGCPLPGLQGRGIHCRQRGPRCARPTKRHAANC
jgi:hypothetical protein